MENILFPEKKKIKLLLIDDESDVCDFLKSSLEKTKKFEVSATTSPRAGISLARAIHPDLILLDIIMYEMDGTEVAEELYNDPLTKDIPVVFVTCLVDDKEIQARGGVLGGRYFIAKPIQPKDLVMRIESILQQATEKVRQY